MMMVSRWTIAVAAMIFVGAAGAPGAFAQEAAAIRKRPLRDYELANSLRDVLLVDVADLSIRELPPLPLVHQGQPIPGGYRKLAQAAVARVFDSRKVRPSALRWTIDFGRGGPANRPGIMSIEASEEKGADPWSTATFDGLAIVQHWADGDAISGSERGLPGIRINNIALPEFGTWRITLRAARATPPVPVRFQPCVLEVRRGAKGPAVLQRELTGEVGQYELIEVMLTVSPGEKLDLAIGESLSLIADGKPSPKLLINRIEVEGPLFDFAGWPPPSQRRVFFESPLAAYPKDYRRAVIERFLARVFRRMPTILELDRFTAAAEVDVAANKSVAEALGNVMTAALCDPAFLYLEDHSGMTAARKLTPHEAASRISYALHGTTPSNEMLAAADAGTLPHTIEKFLTHQQSWKMGEYLAEDWFQLRRLNDLAIPGTPEWPLVRDALRQEARAFLAANYVSRTRPVRLLQADKLMLNRLLVHHYGLFGIDSPAFLPLPIRPGHGRCGIPTLGAVLALACDGRSDRISKRGDPVWRLLFAVGDEKPPADEVQMLDDLLAPFDELGRWTGNRTGPRDITRITSWMGERGQRFEAALANRLATYMVGYPLPADDPAVTAVTSELRANKFATADLQQLARKWLAQPRMWEKW